MSTAPENGPVIDCVTCVPGDRPPVKFSGNCVVLVVCVQQHCKLGEQQQQQQQWQAETIEKEKETKKEKVEEEEKTNRMSKQ